MKILRIFVTAAFLSSFSSLASAYLVTDVISFNRSLATDEVLTWRHNITEYGYVPGRDFIVSEQSSLTLELRDLQDRPGKELEERPFVMFGQGQGRSFARVAMEDIVIDYGLIFVDEFGKVNPFLSIMEGEVWLGDVTLRLEVIPGTPVPEPTPIALIGIGLLALLLSRRRSNGFGYIRK